MKNRKGVNCTDSCHVFYNLGLEFVKQGKYKKVECLHVKCKSGDGHVRLRFTLPNGEKFYRDPASTLVFTECFLLNYSKQYLVKEKD